MILQNMVLLRLNITPPDEVLSKWEEDYQIMQRSMIIGESLDWKMLLQRIMDIEKLFNQV